MPNSGAQTRFSREDSGANRKQDDSSISMDVQKTTGKVSSKCNFCSQRQRIEKLIGLKQHVSDISKRQKILSRKIKVTVKDDQESEMTIKDIENDVTEKFPDWQTAPITVPCYTFPGEKDRISWTEKDINDYVSEKFVILRMMLLRNFQTGKLLP